MLDHKMDAHFSGLLDETLNQGPVSVCNKNLGVLYASMFFYHLFFAKGGPVCFLELRSFLKK